MNSKSAELLDSARGKEGRKQLHCKQNRFRTFLCEKKCHSQGSDPAALRKSASILGFRRVVEEEEEVRKRSVKDPGDISLGWVRAQQRKKGFVFYLRREKKERSSKLVSQSVRLE